MKTIALTFALNILFLGLLFFSYQISETQAPSGNANIQAVAIALGANGFQDRQLETKGAPSRMEHDELPSANQLSFASDQR